MRKYLVAFVLTTVLLSCTEVIRGSLSWRNSDNYEVTGNYFFLDKDNTKLFLPEGFALMSVNDYAKYIDTLKLPQDRKDKEMARIQYAQQVSKNFYMYRDSISESIMTAASGNFLNFNKDDARMLLNILKQNHEREKELTGFSYEKLEANYMTSGDAKIFKAVYKAINPDTKNEVYKNVYIISDNGRTFFFNLFTGFEVYFDPYVLRTRFL